MQDGRSQRVREEPVGGEVLDIGAEIHAAEMIDCLMELHDQDYNMNGYSRYANGKKTFTRPTKV
jgi:hypothetical protein